MHASTQQLLSLRDKELVSADVQQHVAGCAICQQQLNQLADVRNTLRALSEHALAEEPSSKRFSSQWENVQEKIQAKKSEKDRRLRYGRYAIAASVFVCVLALVPVLQNPSSHQPGNDPEITGQSVVQLQQALTQRNKELEQALRQLPQPRKVVSGGTAYTIASLEDQIALVDYQLSRRDQIGMDEFSSIGLLQNRGDLLDSLYKVRYGEAMVSLASYQY